MNDLIGILGAVLIAVGWSFEAMQTIRTRRSHLEWHFNALYAIGSLALVAYALEINSLVFAVLNALALLMALVSLWYKLREKPARKR
jgi:lipid-A-disaccharide synthase-like uncharacterized protein